MGWREDDIAWCDQEIARMRQGIEFMERGILETGEETSRGGPLRSRNDEMIAQYRSSIEALTAMRARLLGEAS